MAPPIRVALATLCAGFAAWQLGAGAAIALKAAVAQQLLHAAWQRTQAGEREVRPWPWADTWPVARLLAPAQNVDLIVLEGASGRILAFGPGHVEGTAAPGEPGISVIVGHRDTHLLFLRVLTTGDALAIETADGHRVPYRVTGSEIVDSRTTAIGAQADGHRTLTLVTCYPFDAVVPGGPLRYVVFAEAALR
jgi:sortase A